jgi:hypothetical protein
VAAFSQTNEAQFYVSMSRARHAMHLYTDSKAALKEAVSAPISNCASKVHSPRRRRHRPQQFGFGLEAPRRIFL